MMSEDDVTSHILLTSYENVAILRKNHFIISSCPCSQIQDILPSRLSNSVNKLCRKQTVLVTLVENITKTRLNGFDPLKPHFYTVKLGFTGVYIIFLISAQNHRLWLLARTALSRRF